MSSESLAAGMPARRRGSHAGVAVRRGRVKASMRHGEDNAKERKHGGMVVSSGHGELTFRRGASHSGGDRNGR